MDRHRALRWAAIYLLLYSCLFALLPRSGHPHDTNCFKNWTLHIMDKGLSRAYEGEDKYSPFFIYLLYLFSKIEGSRKLIADNIWQLKGLFLLFDFLGAVSAMALLRKTDPIRRCAPLVLLFNVAYVYNTMMWGQADSMVTSLAFLSIVFALKGWPEAGLACFVLALNTKPQAILFLPELILLLVPLLRSRPTRVASSLLVTVSAQLVLFLPFLASAGVIVRMSTAKTDYWTCISKNAMNVWYLLFKGDLGKVADDLPILGISCRTWGTLLFLLVSFVVLLPLLTRSVQKWRERQPWLERDYPLAVLVGALVPLVWFYFNTRMHERYPHPAILFLGVYSFVSGKYGLYGLCSVAYLINLDKVLRYFRLIPYGGLAYDESLVSALFLIVIILGLWRLARAHRVAMRGTHDL